MNPKVHSLIDTRRIILDNYQKPYHKVQYFDVDIKKNAILKSNTVNSTCDDNLSCQIIYNDNNQIQSAYFKGEGCIISIATASVFCHILENHTFKEAEEIFLNYYLMINNKPYKHKVLGNLNIFKNTYLQKNRIPCAILASDLLENLINKIKVDNLFKVKEDIRKAKIKERKDLKKEFKNKYDTIICKKVLNIVNAENLDNIAIYVSSNNEVNTWTIIKKLLSQNKTILVPRISGHNTLTFQKINNLDKDLELNSEFNIYQAKPFCDFYPINKIKNFIVPLVAFDDNKNRIGLGKGYYDRTLYKSDSKSYKIGLAYLFQQVDHIQIGKHDIALDLILTN